MLRGLEEPAALRDLDDLAGVHHGDAVRHAGDDAEVMGDEEDRHPALRLERAQQVEHLRLDRDVERGGRLVRHQQLGFAGERERDHHALLHPAGELERIVVDAARTVGDADRVEQLDRPRARFLATDAGMPGEHFADLPPDREHRVQARRRLLEDHRHPPSADVAHPRLGQGEQLGVAEADAAGGDPAGLGQEAHQRECGHALAAARLADDRERLPPRHVEVDAVERAHDPAAAVELGAEIPRFEEIGAHRTSRAPKPRSGFEVLLMRSHPLPASPPARADRIRPAPRRRRGSRRARART